jgi:NNP family nitrate/nitrite transporter-like MFS transporter
VAGIVGAGGNAGAVLAGFLLKTDGLNWHTALFIMGALITTCSFLTFAVTLRPFDETSFDAIPRHVRNAEAAEQAGAIA